MLNHTIPHNSLMAEWLNESELNEEQADLQNELSGWYDKLKSFMQRNKGKAQKLAAVAQIVGRLIGSPGLHDPNAGKPPVTHTNYADLQKVEDRRRRDQIQNKVKSKTTIGGSKELEGTLLGEILGEYKYPDQSLEMAFLLGEIGSIYNKAKQIGGVQSVEGEILFENLELEIYENIKKNTWGQILSESSKKKGTSLNAIKSAARANARSTHFKVQPIGVEVHHWIPFKYAHLLDTLTLEKLNKLTMPLDALSHVLVGAAIDQAMKNQTKENLLKVLNKLSPGFELSSKFGVIPISPKYFRYVSDTTYLPSKVAGSGTRVAIIKDIIGFKNDFGLPRELEFEAVNLY